MHTNSRLLFEKYVRPILGPGMKVLEIGPDAFPSTFQELSRDVPLACWDTLDINDNPLLTYRNSNEYRFEIQSDSYDFVLSGQVIEHVRRPWMWLPELARVVRPGGLVATIGPVSWTYHEAPVDCWRVYPEGMRALYEDAGLETILSRWESLEEPGYKRYCPGVSREAQGPRRRLLYGLLGSLGLPVERAYDTVTIGTKGAPR